MISEPWGRDAAKSVSYVATCQVWEDLLGLVLQHVLKGSKHCDTDELVDC